MFIIIINVYSAVIILNNYKSSYTSSDVSIAETVQYGMLYIESYSAVYDASAYQYPHRRGLAESYVKYQMYSNQPAQTPAYNARMGQYGYDNGSMPATSSLPITMPREYRLNVQSSL